MYSLKCKTTLLGGSIFKKKTLLQLQSVIEFVILNLPEFDCIVLQPPLRLELQIPPHENVSTRHLKLLLALEKQSHFSILY